MKLVPFVILFLVLMGLAACWQVYKFRDCKNVGHSTFYCVMDIGK